MVIEWRVLISLARTKAATGNGADSVPFTVINCFKLYIASIVVWQEARCAHFLLKSPLLMPLTLSVAPSGHGHVGPPALQGFIYSARKTRSPLSNSIDVANHHPGEK